MTNADCPTCSYYFYTRWRSHSPDFPEQDWEIIEKTPIQVGTHAPVDVFQGRARCKACGREADFFCTYGDGYGFQD